MSEIIKMHVRETIQTGGGGGSDAIWLPNVSEEGVISWSKSTSTTAPTARNIKGAAGADGQDGADGEDGLGIKSVDINGSNHLIITYDDDTTKDAGEIGTEYPDYAKTEMESVLSTIQTYISTIDNPIIVGFNTDQHIVANPSSSSAIATRNEVTYGLKTLRDLTKKVPFNAVVLGGDTHGSGSGTIKSMQDSALYVNAQMYGVNCPIASLVGNHEGGQDNQSITRAQVFKSHVTPSVQDKIITIADKSSGYYDDPTCNVRFIFLDAFARTQASYSSVEYNAILNTMLSGVPTGYKALIFSHHPLDENLPYSGGWNNPASCHTTLQLYKDIIIACICGHVHNNIQYEDLDGVTFVATTCAGQYELNDGSTRTNGTAGATAYDVFVIDQTAKKIYAVRYGNGNDREISYAHSTPRGNILANINWTDGKRINSSGQLVDAAGYSVTDAIDDINAGDILFFADGTLPVNTNAWTCYSDDGQSTTSMNGISTETYGATYSNSNMTFMLLNDSGSMLTSGSSFPYRILSDAKNPSGTYYSGSTRYLFGETTFWESGFIKSYKVAYDYENEHFANAAKIRFTFPTAKKGSLDIRVNEPFDE